MIAASSCSGGDAAVLEGTYGRIMWDSAILYHMLGTSSDIQKTLGKDSYVHDVRTTTEMKFRATSHRNVSIENSQVSEDDKRGMD